MWKKAKEKVLKQIRKKENKSDNAFSSYKTAKDSLPSRLSTSSYDTAFNPRPRNPVITNLITMNLKNSEEINFREIEQSIQNWNIPKIPAEQIYIGSFEDTNDFMIQTVERTSSSQDEAYLYLMDDKEKLERLKMRYHYLHIALVQVAIKPLTRK